MGLAILAIVFFALVPLALAARLAFAMRGAFERTIQEQNWLTPEDPWRNFWYFLGRESRAFVIALVLNLLLMIVIRIMFVDDDQNIYDLIFFLSFMLLPVTVLLLQFMVLMILVPRWRNRVALILVSLAGSFALVIVMSLCVSLLPKFLVWVETGNKNGLSGFSLNGFYAFGLALGGAVVTPHLLRKRLGRGWFRRE
jgi:hypothetical protein